MALGLVIAGISGFLVGIFAGIVIGVVASS
jgi:hypothetical protein